MSARKIVNPIGFFRFVFPLDFTSRSADLLLVVCDESVNLDALLAQGGPLVMADPLSIPD